MHRGRSNEIFTGGRFPVGIAATGKKPIHPTPVNSRFERSGAGYNTASRGKSPFTVVFLLARNPTYAP
jgi:hypothetical protein